MQAVSPAPPRNGISHTLPKFFPLPGHFEADFWCVICFPSSAMDPWRLDSRFEFLKCHGSYRVVRYQEVPGTAVVARGVPRLRGTVSGCLSSTKVFHRGREHATLLASVTGRRRPKAVTELTAAISETTVGGRFEVAASWGP